MEMQTLPKRNVWGGGGKGRELFAVRTEGLGTCILNIAVAIRVKHLDKTLTLGCTNLPQLVDSYVWASISDFLEHDCVGDGEKYTDAGDADL